MPSPLLSRRILWLILFFMIAAALACFALPMYVIRPFRAQGGTELAVALVVRQWGPLVATGCALVALIACLALWRRLTSHWARGLATLCALAAIGGAALARVNVYEMMFHPVDTPKFTPPEKSKVAGDDMVLAVLENRSARAYPIRTMGYHHIVNDWAGGTPIVATY